ncbi:MAG: ATP-binding protein [Acidimicrobiia bacterium]
MRRAAASVRGRTTLGATLIVGLALLVGGIGLVIVLQRSLIADLDEIVEIRAFDVAALIAQGDLPPVLATFGDEPSFVQVLDGRGRVVASTASVTGRPPLTTFEPRGAHGSSRTLEGLEPYRSGLRVRGLRAPSAGGDLVVYAGVALLPIEESTAKVRGLLAGGLPPLVLLVALTTWVATGRALRPVEAIRAEVAEMSERDLHRRVPVPGARDEVGRLARTMNGLLDRLEKAVATQRRFVADASHELQSPLASARTDLEVALAHPEVTDWQATGADLLEENRRMERLVQDLLYLARTDEAAHRAPPTPVDLDDVVLAEATRLRGYGRIRVDTSRVAPAAVLGRREELTRAVRNLLDNAERYACSVVSVELFEEEAKETVTLVIADDGPGIPPEHREPVFSRFTRLDEARNRDGGGAGLGLAIVREIVTGHGGTVVVDDRPGGARMVVQLPARP